MEKKPSPCLRCSRVPDPVGCEDKNCQLWQQWFISRWDALRCSTRVEIDSVQPQPVGVPLGGRIYAAPNQVEAYFRDDPCESCLCPRDLCGVPCRVRRDWDDRRREVLP